MGEREESPPVIQRALFCNNFHPHNGSPRTGISNIYPRTSNGQRELKLHDKQLSRAVDYACKHSEE